ncbi:hypothetical protein Lser_V15G33908 [Lactuca serriola]
MATAANPDATLSHTTYDVSSLPIMKIQGTNYQVEANVSLYHEELKMLIVALKSSVLSKAMFNSFFTPLSWLSQAGSTATYSKALDAVTFNLVTDKKVRLSKKLFCQILDIPNSPRYVNFTFPQIVHMFNEMGHQPQLSKISDFKKLGLPSVWNFLFGIFLRCLTGRTVGLDKGRMEVYAMVVGLYCNLQVDYSTHLILQYFYEKEGILVPNDEEKAAFHVYSCPKGATDDTEEFPVVARILDAMLKRVYPTNIVLVTYLQTINTTVGTGILLEREVETKSKRSKKTNAGSSEKQVKESKSTQISKQLPVTEAELTKPEVSVADTPSTQKELILSRTGVFRRIKIKSKHKSRSPLTNVVRKPQVTHQGVLFREIPAPISPSSMKRRATDMDKHISKKKKKKRKIIISSESTADEDETIPETPEADLHKQSSTLTQTDVISTEDLVAKSVSTNENKNFMEVFTLLTELKALSSKPTSISQLSSEDLIKKFSQFKALLLQQLAPLSHISSLLPTTNAPPVSTGMQGGERMSEGLKAGGDDAKVVGKVFPSKIPTTKLVIASSGPVSSTVVITVPITRPISKGIIIGKSVDIGGSDSKVKYVLEESASKARGKSMMIKKSKEEKKAEADAELERMRLVQSIMTQRASDPPGMNKGDTSKHYNYETIEAKVAFNHMYSFEKKPKQSYFVTNTNASQLDFPINEMMFIMPQSKAESKFKEKDEGTHMKIRFHAVLVKPAEEVWSLTKIKKVISIKKDMVFENTIQNMKYVVTRVIGNVCDFTIADFPLMNLYDLIQVALLLKERSFLYLQNMDPDEYKLGITHIKIFIENYYECLELTNVELAIAKGLEITAPMAPSKI